MSFYFFTDYDCLGHQLQREESPGGQGFVNDSPPIYSGAFGKISYDFTGTGQSYNAIHVGDTHKSNSEDIEPYAYAVCNGVVAVVPVKHSNLVNLILKPSVQPHLPIPRIKYFIYRGILRDSIFNDPGNVVGNQQNNNDFLEDSENVAYVLAHSGNGSHDRNNLLESIERDSNLNADRSADILLYNKTKILTDSEINSKDLDSLFVNSEGGYGPNRVVKGGWILGKFPSSKNNKSNTRLDRYTVIPSDNTSFFNLNIFSLEIILESLDYNPKMNLICRNSRAIKTDESFRWVQPRGIRNFNLIPIEPYITTNYNRTDRFKHFAMRSSMETALNYLDPAAFWGSFYRMYTGTSKYKDYGLNARKHTDEFQTTPDEDGVRMPIFTNFIENSIYENIMKGQTVNVTNFANKNRIYIDIRNQYNDSYNLYNDNCYNSTPMDGNAILDVKKNIIYNLNDGQSVNPNRTFLPRNYYNNILPWLIFQVVNGDPYDPSYCDVHVMTTSPDIDKFGNNMSLDADYHISLGFPTASSPLLEQYSLFSLHDSQWKSSSANSRLVLSSNNNIDNYTESKLKYLHYSDDDDSTNELKFYINTCDRADTGVRVPVAGYYRFIFIKHRTKLYEPDATDEQIKLPTHLDEDLRAIKVPRPIEFLDYIFNFKMRLTNGNVPAGWLQNRSSEEYRYADLTRATGWDMVGQAGVSKDTLGDIVFYINGQYQRFGDNHLRINISDTSNVWLSISSNIEKTPDTFLQSLVKSNTSNQLSLIASSTAESIEIKINGNFGNFYSIPLKYFSFIKIPSNDWIEIDGVYSSLIVGADVCYHKINLCFEQIHNDCNLPNKYNYWLKGFIVKQVGSDYEVNNINQQVGTIINYNNFVTINPDAAGTNLFSSANVTSTAPAAFNNDSDVIFGSTVYMLRGMNLTYRNYYDLCKGVETDLQKVFSSTINGGLVDILNDDSLDINSITYRGKILQAIPPKLLFFRNAEVLFLLACRSSDPNAIQRSYARPLRRLAVLFMPVPLDANFEKYTSAHEYAHILGLDDRYGYMANMDINDDLLINEATGSGIPLFIPGDGIYSNNYRWYFNLMSTAKIVPLDFSTLIFGNEGDFTTPYNSLKPVGSLDSLGYYSKFALFLSPEQWKVMAKVPSAHESIIFGKRQVFLFSAAAGNHISFAGVNEFGIDLSDADFIGNSGSMATRITSNLLGSITYQNENEIMADKNLQDDLEKGGFVSEGLINRGIGLVDLSGSKDKYLTIETQIRQTTLGGGIANSNPGFAIDVWRFVKPSQVITGKPFTNPKLSVKYQKHPNRVVVVKIISKGQ